MALSPWLDETRGLEQCTIGIGVRAFESLDDWPIKLLTLLYKDLAGLKSKAW